MEYFLRRLGFYLVALWVAVTMNFLLPRMMPGDPIDAIIARNQGRLPPAAINALRAQLGLSHAPLWQQYLTYLGQPAARQPWRFVRLLSRHRFQRVWRAAYPGRLSLLGVALLISAVLGTLLGIAAAWRRGGS